MPNSLHKRRTVNLLNVLLKNLSYSQKKRGYKLDIQNKGDFRYNFRFQMTTHGVAQYLLFKTLVACLVSGCDFLFYFFLQNTEITRHFLCTTCKRILHR